MVIAQPILGLFAYTAHSRPVTLITSHVTVLYGYCRFYEHYIIVYTCGHGHLHWLTIPLSKFVLPLRPLFCRVASCTLQNGSGRCHCVVLFYLLFFKDFCCFPVTTTLRIKSSSFVLIFPVSFRSHIFFFCLNSSTLFSTAGTSMLATISIIITKQKLV